MVDHTFKVARRSLDKAMESTQNTLPPRVTRLVREKEGKVGEDE